MEIYHPKDDELLREMRRVRRVQKRKRTLWGLLFFLVLSAAFGWFVFNRYCTLAVFRGHAMGDTLKDGSLVLVWRDENKNYQRGDIVLYETESGAQIKRILAVGGDQVVISPYTQIRVNGVNQDAAYLVGRNADAGFRTRRLTVEDHALLLWGDQLSLSVDSRHADYETIQDTSVVGRVRFVLWPISHFGMMQEAENGQQGGGV